MKKQLLFLFSFFCISINSLYAQNDYFVGDISITNIDAEYIEIRPQNRTFNTGFILFVVFGQPSNSLSRNDTRLKTFDNKDVIFNSRIDALNFMLSQDYEHVSSYTTSEDIASQFYYLLRKVKRN